MLRVTHASDRALFASRRCLSGALCRGNIWVSVAEERMTSLVS